MSGFSISGTPQEKVSALSKALTTTLDNQEKVSVLSKALIAILDRTCSLSEAQARARTALSAVDMLPDEPRELTIFDDPAVGLSAPD